MHNEDWLQKVEFIGKLLCPDSDPQVTVESMHRIAPFYEVK